MKCPHCQTNSLDNAEFCKECSKPIHMEVICSHCQHHNTPDSKFCVKCGEPLAAEKVPAPTAPAGPPQPISFAGGRYQAKKFPGEGGTEKVYLAHSTVMDQDVAFAPIKTEKLDNKALTLPRNSHFTFRPSTDGLKRARYFHSVSINVDYLHINEVQVLKLKMNEVKGNH